MPEPTDNRVAVYIDFDNIVISRYSQVHPKNRHDRLREYEPVEGNEAMSDRLHDAEVDIGAVLDYATSLGTIAVSRAYADWSLPINRGYSDQLINRAVDLIQMFPTVKSMKNGADIRLAVDAIEDLFTLKDITHVVLVSGDSDYIALAQKTKKLGRYVVGVGVAGSVSATLAAACDEFVRYEDLPGVQPSVPVEPVAVTQPKTAKKSDAEPAIPRRGAAGLLYQALLLGHDKDDAEWLHAAAVKQQMRRMDPTFNEKELGFSSFTAFVTSHTGFAELAEDGQRRMIRLRPGYQSQAK
jgi:uncharacterized protein (TIGR00288 family)